MKKNLEIGLLVACLLQGSWSGPALAGPFMASYWSKGCPDGCSVGLRESTGVPGLVGPWGQPVDPAFPYNASPPSGEVAARAMLQQSVPYDLQFMMAQEAARQGSLPGSMGMGGPGGMPMMNSSPVMGGGLPGTSPTPAGLPSLPAGVVGAYSMPGGGVVQAGGQGYGDDGGLLLTQGKTLAPKVSALSAPFPVQRTEVRFAAPAGMKISWFTTQADGKQGFGPQSLEAPGRYNFLQAAIYRLKLSDVPNRPGVELYPTLEVVPGNSKTSTFLAHSAVPVNFSDEDFDQVASGNMVVKVIYLPDPGFQELATTGLAEVNSAQLEPGTDPIQEAQRRGSILLVVRLGNIDLEAANTPPMDAPGAGRMPMGAPPAGQILNMQPNLANGPPRMVPYGAMPNPNARPPSNFPYPTVPNFNPVPLPQQPANPQGNTTNRFAPGMMPPNQGYPPQFPPGYPVSTPGGPLPSYAPAPSAPLRRLRACRRVNSTPA